jgi:hypothetical protein
MVGAEQADRFKHPNHVRGLAPQSRFVCTDAIKQAGIKLRKM